MEAPWYMRAVFSCSSGILFGIAIEKGRVFEPQVIRDQMTFERFVMLKMFLAASVGGMMSFSFMYMIPETAKKMDLAVKVYQESLRDLSLSGVIVGAALLGTGMTIAGACPGTVLIQVGTQVPNAWFTVSGGLLGALFYSLTYTTWNDIFKSETRYRYYFLDKYLRTPLFVLALPFASMLAVVIFAAELYAPWYTEVSVTTEGIMGAEAWPPFVSGLIIGLLQIPMVIANTDTLGSSSSYVTIVSQLFRPFDNGSGNDYLRRFRSGMGNWWQVFYVCGAAFGGYLSATASGSMNSVAGFPWYQTLGGGFLIVFGARMAGGCTSGHGLSGIGLMALLSFAAVPAMFGGGIATAVFMKYFL